MTTIIHPTFFLGESGKPGKWRYGDVRASTIAALLDKLGPDYEVQDYYRGITPKEVTAFPAQGADTIIRPSLVDAVPKQPMGRRTTSPPRRSVESRTPVAVEPAPIPVPIDDIEKKKDTRSSESLRNDILDRWEAGMTGPAIAEILGIDTGRISKAISRWRKQGDPRAVVRVIKADAVDLPPQVETQITLAGKSVEDQK